MKHFDDFQQWHKIHMEMGKLVCFDRNWQESIKTIEFWIEKSAISLDS